MAPIKTGIVGYGMSAKIFHLPFVLSLPEQFALHSIVQRSPKPGDDAGADFPGIKTYKSLADMLKDPEVELVIITSIPSTHYDMCKDALTAGKHVLCEKPFVPTSKEAQELAALAKQQQKVLTVYQNRRWDADFVTLQSLVKQGTLGRLVEVESHFDRHRPEAPKADSASWKARNEPGNGAIYDLGTHLLDQLVTLLGMPEKVLGLLQNQRIYGPDTAGSLEDGDSFTVLLQYPSKGIVATAKAAVVSLETEQLRFWVRGEKGTFKIFNLDPQEDQLKAGVRPPAYKGPVGSASPDYGVVNPCGTVTSLDASGKPGTQPVKPETPPETYVEFYRLLGKAIAGQGENPVPAEQAANVLRVIKAAQESSRTGQTVSF